MFNDEEWTPRPLIEFVTGVGSVILTCKNNSGGTEKIYINPPRQPKHVLPSEKGNQLCYACINPRTIKTVKASKYCTKFQMI